MTLGILAALLAPAIVLLGMGAVAVVRRRYWEEFTGRRRGTWRVYAPQQDGPWKAVGRWWLVRKWERKDRV